MKKPKTPEMPGYRLSRQAERSLEHIIGWTMDHFGIEQAIRYKDRLTRRLSSLAKRELPHGRPCGVLVSGWRNVSDLEYFREGRHFVIYRNSPDGLFVVDFIHGSRNLEIILGDLSKTT